MHIPTSMGLEHRSTVRLRNHGDAKGNRVPLKSCRDAEVMTDVQSKKRNNVEQVMIAAFRVWLNLTLLAGEDDWAIRHGAPKLWAKYKNTSAISLGFLFL